LYAQLFAYSVSILIAVFIIVRRYATIDFRHFDLGEMRAFCVKSLPYALLILLMGIYMRSDALLLERLKGPPFSSIYAEAYRVLDAFNMLGFLFAGILLPLFTRLITGGNEIVSISRMSTNIMLTISLAILGFSISYKSDIMYFLDHSADEVLPLTYLLVIASFPAYCLIYVYTTLLTANGDIHLLIRLAVIACLISLGFNLILIPSWGVIGAAITANLVIYSMAFMSIFYCVQKFPFKMDIRWTLKFVALFLLIAAFNSILKLLDIKLELSVILNIPLFFILVYVIRLWDRDALLNYFKLFRSRTSNQ
jgi:O-antigen/teichoic acid export membrane protein